MPQFPLPGAGQVITYQLAGVKPYGMRYKITPETTEKEVNARKCFQLPVPTDFFFFFVFVIAVQYLEPYNLVVC